jgi:hypothetical protein
MKEASVAAIENGKITNQSVLFEVKHAIRTKNLATTSWLPYQRTQVSLTVPEIK